MNQETTLQRIKELIDNGDMLLKLFNMEVIEYDEGIASVRMKVIDSHLNAAKICHGGVVFSLADVAFALASNSYGNVALALDMSISYLKAVRSGTMLTARCSECKRSRRTGTYLIEVKDASGDLVALLKATAFIKETRHFND
jgi:acyl-CoA thioesterase